MYIKIGTPRLIQGIGKRNHQEDAYSPSLDKLDDSCKAFAVCDGMGGHEHGEVASRLVADGLIDNYLNFMGEMPTTEHFLSLFKYVRHLLDNHPHADDGERHMGTTLTFVALTPEGVLAAHLGDSTIYVIRPDNITEFLYRSEDHSLVYRLIQHQQLSPIQALTYQSRNELDKAVLPYEDIEPDIELISDIQSGDYILLCTDGVTEYLTDEMIRFIFAPYRTLDEISYLIQSHCSLSSDNHTALIIPILGVEHDENETENDAESMVEKITPPEIDINSYLKKEAEWALQRQSMGVNTQPNIFTNKTDYNEYEEPLEEELYSEKNLECGLKRNPKQELRRNQDSELGQETAEDSNLQAQPSIIKVNDYSILKDNKFTSDTLLEETRKSMNFINLFAEEL